MSKLYLFGICVALVECSHELAFVSVYWCLFAVCLRRSNAAMKCVLMFLFLIQKACSQRPPSSNSSLYCDSALNKEQRDVTRCLDQIAIHNSDVISNRNGINNHFVFLGDSRIRQQFYGFCRVIVLLIKLCQYRNQDECLLDSSVVRLDGNCSFVRASGPGISQSPKFITENKRVLLFLTNDAASSQTAARPMGHSSL